MSGIVGILHLDGAPIDRPLLQRLTNFQAFRGPDAQQVWVDDQCGASVGFGHTLLKTTPESEHEHQPLSLDGQVWIVADARVDAQRDLITKLEAQGQEVAPGATDVELILRAYHAWGQDCVEHLLGDFAFGIWDGPRRRLFCACDQMGVKPFYYAHIGSIFIFSNTLNCIRQHPAVSDTLNDLAIADFLLLEINQDPCTTSFADIQRLPPAHLLECRDKAVSVRRYWSLSVTGPLLYRRQSEYLEHFHELLDASVTDRLRTDKAAILMSGGLDSPTVAMSAKRVFTRQGIASGLCAYTHIFDGGIPDEERHYAGLVAEGLNIPIHYQKLDGYGLFDGAGQPEYNSPEPTYSLCPRFDVERFRQIATSYRVLLTGFGADPGLSSLISVHLSQLIRNKQFGRAVADVWRYLGAEQRLSRLYLRVRLRRYFTFGVQQFPYPEWLNEDLERQLGLRKRWERLNTSDFPPGAFRPEAQTAITDISWRRVFEGYDAGVTRTPIETRHPFFDLRLVNFLLALPTLPWCADKQLFREAARGVLPNAVRLRPKTPSRINPVILYVQRPEAASVDDFEAAQGLERYVVRSRIPRVFRQKDPWRAGLSMLPLTLNHWLRARQAVVNKCSLVVYREAD